jgi:AraC-like DNA-binding protein
MGLRKPFLEKVAAPDEGSWRLFDRRLEALPFEWHYHPEYELTFTLNSRGRRYVGDHIGAYDDRDLVLVGSNLPHTWHSGDRIVAGAPHRALVLWFTADWIGRLTEACVELRWVERLLGEAGRGIAFSRPVADSVAPIVLAMVDASGPRRLTGFLEILATLAGDADRQILASPGAAREPGIAPDGGRIGRVLSEIHARYRDPDGLAATELAALACVSISSFHRLFKRHTGTTLASSDRPIAHIADTVGYNSLANFNRQFRACKGTTPRAFRRGFAV